jgi:hypothetical protein
MKLVKGFGLLAALIVFTAFTSHKFYVSLVQIDHKQESGSLQVTMRIFTDDLERALDGYENRETNLGTQKELPGTNEILFNYISDNFRVTVNGRPATLSFVGKEVEVDVTWCYVEATGIPSLQSISVTNRMLTEVYEEQVNIIQIESGGINRSMLLKGGKPSDSVVFGK